MNARNELLIELYFANALSEAESLELKSALASDAETAAEFEWQLKLSGQVSKMPLSGSIQNPTWREAAKPPSFRQVNMFRTLLAVAAAVSLVIVAYLFIPGLGGGQTLAAGSFEHFPNKMKFKNLGAVETPVSPDILEAFAAYDEKNYTLAATKLSAVVQANPAEPDYRFYLGVSSVGAEKYAEAMTALLPVAQDANSSYNTPALYFLGVAYAGVKDAAEARKYLQQYIAAEDGVPYRQQAQKLLEKLK